MPRTNEAYREAVRLAEAVLTSCPDVIFNHKPVNYRNCHSEHQIRAAQIAEFIAMLAQELGKAEKQFRPEE